VNADDQRLISACLAGDNAAFGALVTRYQDRLYNTVFRLVGNTEDARDVVQESFLSAYQSLTAFKGDSLFFTWLYRIAINNAISMKRRQRAMLRLAPGLESGAVSEPADLSDAARPGRSLEMAEDEQTVQQALNQLSPEHRAVLVLKDMEGRKYEEMAELLEVPIGTVRSRLHRARLELRDVLLKEEKKIEH
jgi:RNA polymerase sigma-70 factor, ECF subfamily